MVSNEKRKRFEKVASNRVQRVIDTLDLLKNCSNRSNYDYTLDDVELMFYTMGKTLRETKAAFLAELESKDKRGFSFKKK
jgi:hypothetical protein